MVSRRCFHGAPVLPCAAQFSRLPPENAKSRSSVFSSARKQPAPCFQTHSGVGGVITGRDSVERLASAHNLASGGDATNLAARARECAQTIPAPRRRPQSIVTDAPAHRRRHPAGGRGGRIWRYFRSAHAHRGHAGGWGGSRKAARRLSPPHSSSGSESLGKKTTVPKVDANG